MTNGYSKKNHYLISLIILLIIIVWSGSYVFLAHFSQPKPIVVGYWYSPPKKEVPYPIPNSFKPDGTPKPNKDMAEKLNYLDVIIYAFLQVKSDGSVYFPDSYMALSSADDAFCLKNNKNAINSCLDNTGNYKPKLGNFSAFAKLKKKYHSLKTIISIGGAGESASFKNAIANIKTFTESIKNLMMYYHLDGIDLDFEPSSFSYEEAIKYANLIQALRNTLGKDKLIFVTLAMNQNIPPLTLRYIAINANYIMDMCYEFHSPFSDPHITTFSSNLYSYIPKPKIDGHTATSCDESVDKLLAVGIPPHKIILGYPSFGITYGGVGSSNQGLFQVYQPGDTPTFDSKVKLPGAVRYSTILQLLKEGFTEYTDYIDDHINASWAYNPTSKQFIAYDNYDLVLEKARYVLRKRLGGLMTWTINDDAPITSDKSLLKAANVLRR